MSFKISSLSPAPQPDTESTGSISLPSAEGGGSFHDVLSSAINEVEGAHNAATQSVERFLSGEGDDLHSTILASQRADLEFQMFMQVRNKVVSAYQEIMKMQM
jgi:flagellar hook-basal body complex protein FliE